MKHINTALELIDNGKTSEAMDVLENLMALAPRNPEALRLKARILDGWGRFDDSTRILQAASQAGAVSEDLVKDIEARAFEEREALVYSELTPEGRCFFAYPAEVIWISGLGFLGCAGFLTLSPRWVSDGAVHMVELLWTFFICVVIPWMALMTVHMRGIKRIYVGSQVLKVCWRFRELAIPWRAVKYAVIESDPDPHVAHLRLKLFADDPQTPLIDFDISQRSSVVRARRHFVRSVVTYVDTVCYLSRAEKLPDFLDKNIDDNKEIDENVIKKSA